MEYGSQWRSMLNFGSNSPPKMDISLVSTGNVIYQEALLNPWSGHDPVSQLMGTRPEAGRGQQCPRGGGQESERGISGNSRAVNELLSNADVSLYGLWRS